MRKILHISNTDIKFDSRILKELKALTELPSIQISAIGVPDGTNYSAEPHFKFEYINLQLISRTLKKFPRAVRYFFELVEFTYGAVKLGSRIQPDIVHCHDTFALPAGWFLKTKYNCKLVYDAHELESDKNSQNFLLSKATLLIEKFCWNSIDLLISVSDSIIDWYIYNLGHKPSVLVLNSPSIERESTTPSGDTERNKYFHSKYSIPEESVVFVYVGLLSPGRGIQFCLDAFANGPVNAHIVFIGFGVLEEMIRGYSKIYTNIHFHDPVPHEKVVSLLRTADYGLCFIEKASLSDYYCLPNKLFEYSFAGIPIVASSFPEIKRIIDQYSLGICCHPSPSEIKKTLTLLSKNKLFFKASDISELSWETQAARLKTAYNDQLLNGIIT